MKAALFISGYLRSFEINIENIKKHIIQENDCDIYIHINDSDTENDTKYINKKTSIETVRRELKPKVVLVSDNFHFSSDTKKNNLFNQNYKFYWLNEERKRVEDIEKQKYDIIIKIRPDVFLNERLPYETATANTIYIPTDSKIDLHKLTAPQDPYICDIIAYGTPESMNRYFDFFLHLENLIDHYGIVNETLLYHYLRKNGISYQSIDIPYIVILSLCNTIAITGDSGSGKTTLSRIITHLFQNSFTLECDRYHKWERGNEKWSKITHLNPEANYITKMNNDVFDLKIGNTVYQVDYDHKTGKFTDNQVIESKENIIVCGLHSLYIPDHIVNLKIYMDTDDNVRIPWKIKRDIEKRGYSMEKIMKQIEDRKADFQKYIYPQKEKADIIIAFYTNRVFDVSTFDVKDEIPVFLKIGIHKKHHLNRFVGKLLIDKIEEEDSFFYLYFDDLDNYKNIIEQIILNI